MTKTIFLRRSALAVAALCTYAAPAFSLTANELWGQWKDYMQGYGYEISAKESSSGGALTISDLKMTLPLEVPDAPQATMSITMGEMTFTDAAGGTVEVSMPSTMPMTIDVVADGEEPVTVAMTQTTAGFLMTASGTAEKTHYDYTAESFSYSVDSVEQDGKAVDLGTIQFTIAGMTGTADMERGAAFKVVQGFKVSELTYTVDIKNPEPGEDGSFKVAGRMAGIEATGDTTIPEGIDMTDLGSALKAGYAVSGTLNYAAGNSALAFQEGNDNFMAETASSGGSFEMTLSADRVVYDVTGNNVNIKAQGAEIPFPIDVTAKEIGMAVRMPLVPSQDTQDFGARISVVELGLPAEVWMMGDPGNALPHDPVTAVALISGTGKLMVDLLDEAALAQLGGGGMPAMIETLKLEKLDLKAAGAQITATADLDVDNQAMSPFGPFPNVFGTADLRLMGVRGLVEKLVQMGLIPQGQALMINGMVSELGKQETGPDDLSANIVLSPQGALTVNDKPIPLQ